MEKTRLFALLLLLTVPCHADLIANYGLGILRSAQDSITETKFFSLAYQSPTFLGLTKQFEIGVWADTSRTNSLFAGAGLGPTIVLPSGFFAQVIIGANLITMPDDMLGGPFQFSHDVSIGIRDLKGLTIGLSYKHFSSGGLEQPNYGRDFITIRLGAPIP